MSTSRTLTLTAALALVVVNLAACTGAGGGGDQVRIENAIFGDGTLDPTPVLATVDGIKITQRMLDFRFEDLPKDLRNRYQGDDGKRLLLYQMVNEVLRVREAQRRKLDRVPENARVLIAQRRTAMDTALTNDMIKDQKPTNEQIREYYLAHRDRYFRLGTMSAAHIECTTREAADKAYREVTNGKPFPYAVGEYSVNVETKKNQGSLGSFNKGGYLPFIRDAQAFTERIWDLPDGVNPPLEFGGKWHVVQINGRQQERPQTLEEAYENVTRDMMTDFQLAIVEKWLRDARQTAKIEYFGDFRPGKGRTARELLERAINVKDPEQRIELYALLYQDFPDDELADDALFMAANDALDSWGDTKRATEMLTYLLEKHPDSEFAADAKYMIDNMNRPDFVKPKTIEDLRSKR